ncbi:hypothetical protein GCM10027035_17960 [Emticicia sediminis]
MKNLFSLILILICGHITNAQLPQVQYYNYEPRSSTNTESYRIPPASCDELISTVEYKLRKKGSISPIQLLDSSWLESVDGYEYKGEIIVIAKIK